MLKTVNPTRRRLDGIVQPIVRDHLAELMRRSEMALGLMEGEYGGIGLFHRQYGGHSDGTEQLCDSKEDMETEEQWGRPGPP